MIKDRKYKGSWDFKEDKTGTELLEKAEDEANKTMDPKLKKKSDELLKKFLVLNKFGYWLNHN